MSKITAIKEQKRKGRFNIYLDGQFAFGLSAEALVGASLVIGQEISEEQLKILKNEDIKSKLYNNALRFLSYRPRSEKEVRDYLYRKIRANSSKIRGNQGASKTIEIIIKKLKAQDLLNDAEFIKWWIEQRQTFRPKGSLALKQELRQKGISNSLITELINDLITPEVEPQIAKKLANKKLEQLKKLSPLQKKQKLTRLLAYRGFSYNTIKLTLDEVLSKK